MATQEIKWVVCEQSYTGRRTAKRGLSFASQADAEAWIVTNIRDRFRYKYTAESRRVEADDTSERMTCQCCGGKYLARAGSVAHHGYERPGWGYQTSSCVGAKHLPFEKDHARLDLLIVQLDTQAKTLRENAKLTKANQLEVSHTMTDYTVEVARRFAQRPSTTVRFTKEDFAEVYAANLKNFSASTHEKSFEYFRDAQVARLLSKAKQTEAFKADREAFRKTWKHTHNYNKAIKEWVAL